MTTIFKRLFGPPAVAEDARTKVDRICTYCGNREFYEGPSGGMSTNVLCANPACRHWFNSSPFGMEDLRRIEPTIEEKNTEVQTRKAKLDRDDMAIFEEGMKLFERGDKPLMCLVQNRRDRQYTAPQWEDIIRLAGWMYASSIHNES